MLRFAVTAAFACHPELPGMDAPSTITVAVPGVGERPLVVTGTVFRPDGKTPAPGVVLYVYHTGSDGEYGGPPPKYRGWVRTGADGSYAYRTIRPAPYPNATISAHVHTQLWAPDVPPQWGTDLLFADDPLVSAVERDRSASLGRFAFVCDPGETGRCVHDLRLETDGDTFEPVTRHGLDGS